MPQPVCPPIGPGRFIDLEGPDGSGKTTQAARLVAWLRTFAPDVVTCRDPGGTTLGEAIRAIVKGPSTTAISIHSEMLLFMASRAQMVDEVIAPALMRGAVVVTDRFLLSNVVYQGRAGGLDPEEIWSVGRIATGGLMPDLTILIDLPPELASARIGPARDRIENRGSEYRDRVRQGYLDEVAALSTPSAVIDGSLGPDDVELSIRHEVNRALGIGPRP